MRRTRPKLKSLRECRMNWNKIFDEGTTIVGLVLISAFTIWVALTQTAALAAPIAALCAAVLLFPVIGNSRKTIAEQFRRPLGGIAMVLAAILWLLSTTQSAPAKIPTNPVEAWIILLGLVIAATVIITMPLVFAVSRLTSTRPSDDPKAGRIQDYTISIVCTAAVYFLMLFMAKLSEVLIGPLENEGTAILVGIVWSPVIGWFLAYMVRNPRKQRNQVKQHPSEDS